MERLSCEDRAVVVELPTRGWRRPRPIPGPGWNLVAIAATLVGLAMGCDGGGAAPDDGGGRDGDIDGRDEAPPASDAGGDGDEGQAPLPGPLTFVVSELEGSTERWCDLDGDGTLDNAVADLGPTNAAVFGVAMRALLEGQAQDAPRLLWHLPWVADTSVPADPSATITVLVAEDLDRPPDRSDDLTGDEPFWIRAISLDSCGGPLHGTPVSIDDGLATTEVGTVEFPLAVTRVLLRGGSIRGTFAPHGESAEADICGYVTIDDFGATEWNLGSSATTLLGALVSGGMAFGLPTVPGLSPDVDLDGDGLERLLVTDEAVIESCIDGDSTVIEGADCWRDERIADGFALNISLRALPARLLGPEPTWSWEVGGRCEDRSEAASAWGPCVADACERWETEACVTACGAAGRRTCAWGCDEWSACQGDAGPAVAPSSCGQVSVEGSASCDAETGVATLLDARPGKAAVRLLEPITVGEGPFTVEAAVKASLGSTAFPDFGWAVVAARPSEHDWLLGPGTVPANVALEGMAARWAFTRAVPDDERDTVQLVALRGQDTWSDDNELDWEIGETVMPTLDSTTEGAVEQRLRLVIEPDRPETVENEMMAVAQIGLGGEFHSPDITCHGDECLVSVAPGDELVVGVTASTVYRDSSIELDLDGTSLVVEARGACE